MGKTKLKTIEDYINEYVDLFLETNAESEVVESWKSDDNQKNFKNMIKGYNKKEVSKAKKIKHKDEPKKWSNAYIHFCKKMILFI